MKITPRYLTALMLTALFVGFNAVASAQPVNSPGRPGLADTLEDVTPAVVNIAVRGHRAQAQNPLFNDPLFQRFFDLPEQMPQQRPRQSVGSGVVIDAEQGYILSNHHVVADAEQIEVTLQDRRTVEARLIGSDQGTDIALLQVEADDLVALRPSDSDTLRVGDFVAAIGNPFAIGQTVTTGIVSALGRSGINREGFEDFIQTDASINPGNSGGALVDYNGELIGINTAIISPAGGNVGIGFAVPINMAMSIVDQLLQYGEIRRGMLGVQITDLAPDLAETLNLDITEGAVVQQVMPDTPAQRAGIEAGDIIVAVNGSPIAGMTDLRNTIGLTRAGTEVALVVLRDNERLEISTTITGQEEVVASDGGEQGSDFLDGVQLTSAPAGSKVQGVLVAGISETSSAYQYGLRGNDIITAVNRQRVSSVDELREQLSLTKGAVALSVNRDGQSLFLVLR